VLKCTQPAPRYNANTLLRGPGHHSGPSGAVWAWYQLPGPLLPRRQHLPRKLHSGQWQWRLFSAFWTTLTCAKTEEISQMQLANQMVKNQQKLKLSQNYNNNESTVQFVKMYKECHIRTMDSDDPSLRYTCRSINSRHVCKQNSQHRKSLHVAYSINKYQL